MKENEGEWSEEHSNHIDKWVELQRSIAELKDFVFNRPDRVENPESETKRSAEKSFGDILADMMSRYVQLHTEMAAMRQDIEMLKAR